MPVPGPGYSITVRVEAPPSASAAGDLAGAAGRAGAVITAFDVVESHTDRIVVDITANTYSADHAEQITAALAELPRSTVPGAPCGPPVLGLGNIGPAAALPVMEGKAALFKKFAGVDAWPVCLDTQDTDEIVRTIELIAPVYGAINLEDIAAPRCF